MVYSFADVFLRRQTSSVVFLISLLAFLFPLEVSLKLWLGVLAVVVVADSTLLLISSLVRATIFLPGRLDEVLGEFEVISS